MKNYRFITDEEPSDDDLSELMKEVVRDAKIKPSFHKLYFKILYIKIRFKLKRI